MNRSGFSRTEERLGIALYVDVIRRALREFLATPLFIIVLFLLLSIGAYLFERSDITLYSPARDYLERRVFADAQVTSNLLSTIAGGLITVTSITTTLLLLIVQQTASNMTTQVFDQYLRRRSNQIYFGFFVGLALYTLITLATVGDTFNPIFSASLAFLLTVVALFLLIILFYSTVHQMRPVVIILAIHDLTLQARKRQQDLLRKTRRKSEFEAPLSFAIRASQSGFVTNINSDALKAVTVQLSGQAEIVLHVSIGSFVAFQQVIAEVKLNDLAESDRIEDQIRQAIHLETSRDLTVDPSYGIEQLEIIAWSVTSSAKGNAAPALQVVFSLRDILARWSQDNISPVVEEPLPIVYNDGAALDLIGSYESLAVAASESMQHRILSEILISFTIMFNNLPPAWQDRTEDALLRITSTLGDHVLTLRLETALSDMVEVLKNAGRVQTATTVQQALDHLRGTVGQINSRSSRV
jgi:uncharacterized membrane protein